MASIIKNQILKYLSRYFKNLSTDKINFSTIKGEGELAQLELDETALTDLLELPAWMRITSAMCNKVTFQIPWTKLKSEPMIWNLDEVKVTVETCEELRSPDEGSPNLLQSPGKYNFIIRTVDGMTINVNTVLIDFSSPTFTASLQILRIIVESTSSAWEKCDLRHTRIKDSKRGQILLFKEVRWQNLRIEAKSIIEEDLPPLRLLTNETAVCRIIIKKRLSDCFIMGSKLVLILKELLWVLTDSQLKAALHFLDSLSGLIKKANEVVRKKKAARKLEVLPEYQAQVSQQETLQKKSAVSHIFSCHDVIETSYHFVAQKIHLHLSDDPGPERSIHPELEQGASIRIQLSAFQVDYYPYHLAIKDRDHWGLYKTSRYPHPQWLSQSQNEFRNLLLSLVQDDFSTDQCSSPLSKTSILQNGVSFQSRPAANHSLRNYLTARFNKIMTSCTVLRIGDFVVHRVTSKKDLPKEFIKADKERYKLPETEIIHAEFTYYYYPGDIQFPLPPPKFYVQVYPVQIQFDVLSIVWLNMFFLNLHKSLLTTATIQDQQAESQLFYFDVKIEVTMPQIVFDTGEEKNIPKDRPRTFQIEVSKISVTNTRSNGSVSSRANLAKVVNACQMKSLFLSDDFPTKSSDFAVVTDKFIDHVQGKDNIRNFPSKLLNAIDNEEDIAKSLFQELLWIDAKDVWCIHLESIWGDFGGVRAVGNNVVPFLDAFPLTVWVHMDSPMSTSSNDKFANLHVLASVTNLISVQINKYQAMFLTKVLKSVSELTTFLTLDADRSTKGGKSASVVVASVIPQIEVTLVTASQGTSKESSGGDVESSSVVPDSSSLDTHSVYWTNTVQNSFDISNAGDDSRKNVIKYKTESGCVVSQAPWEAEEMNTKSGNTFTQFKKNFSNFISMDFSAKSVDENSDSLSMRSDDSSDTENYLMRSGSDQLYLDDSDAMFRINYKKKVRPATVTTFAPNVEVADEALNEYMGGSETPTTNSEKDSLVSGWKRKDNVAATTLKLCRLEFMMQSVGLLGSVKMQIDNVGIEECFSIPWDELQNKFSSRIRNWCEMDDMKSDFGSDARIKLRFENEVHFPDFASGHNYNVSQWRDSRLNVIVKDLLLEVQPQTIKCLTELLEDQKLDDGGKPVLFEILIDSVKLLFKEDYMDLKDDSTVSPLVFKKLQILRESDGVINIQPYGSDDISRDVQEVSVDRIQSMSAEIELLRKRLAAMNYLKEENLALRQYEEETKLLRSCLTAAQNQIAHLLDERRKMMERMPRLSSSHVSENSGTCKR